MTIDTPAAAPRGEQDESLAPAQPSLRFLDFPPELRTLIYEFVDDYGILMDFDYHKAFEYPSLLAVNRQIRQEFLPVYYEQDRLCPGPFAARHTHERELNAWK